MSKSNKIRAVDFAEYVENCRKDLIQLHKEKGLIINEDMSLKSAVDLTNHYPVQEYKFRPQDDLPELPDLFELIDNEPLIEEDTPVTIDVLIDINLTQSIKVNSGEVVKTSDGAVYRADKSSGTTYSHIWDTSKDIDTPYAFKMRWVMCIGSSSRNFADEAYASIIAKLRRNASINSLLYQYSNITRYLYLDNCTIDINESTTTSLTAPSCIMVRNCLVNSCNMSKNVYIRNEELINTNNLIPCGSYKNIGIYNTDISDLIATDYRYSYSIMNTKFISSFSGTKSIFITSEKNSTNSIMVSGISSASRSQTIAVLNTTFTNIVEDNRGNTLTIGTLTGALDLKNTINYNIKFPNSRQLRVNRKTMINVLNKLKDLAGQEAKTCTFGSYNLANLTEEEIAIGTNKNWTIS